MSFVYAETKNNTLDIYCDTKIGLDNFAGATFSLEQAELIRKYGIVKTVLICPELAISFAGNNIYLASKLFKRLSEKKIFSTQEVVDMAYDTHVAGKKNDVEFIVASCEYGKLSLQCIKECEVYSDCKFAWIGSPVAHSEFQKFRNFNNEGKASDRTQMAFLDVVRGCSDSSVGGFCIEAGYNSIERCMGYRNCKTFQNSNFKVQVVQPGEEVCFYMNSEDGGFSFEQMPMSLSDLILRVDQMEPAILYSRRLRMNRDDMDNPQLFSMMLPMLVRER